MPNTITQLALLILSYFCQRFERSKKSVGPAGVGDSEWGDGNEKTHNCKLYYRKQTGPGAITKSRTLYLFESRHPFKCLSLCRFSDPWSLHRFI